MIKKNPVNFLFPTESARQIFPSWLLSRHNDLYAKAVFNFVYVFQSKLKSQIWHVNLTFVRFRCVRLAAAAGIH